MYPWLLRVGVKVYEKGVGLPVRMLATAFRGGKAPWLA